MTARFVSSLCRVARNYSGLRAVPGDKTRVFCSLKYGTPITSLRTTHDGDAPCAIIAKYRTDHIDKTASEQEPWYTGRQHPKLASRFQPFINQHSSIDQPTHPQKNLSPSTKRRQFCQGDTPSARTSVFPSRQTPPNCQNMARRRPQS